MKSTKAQTGALLPAAVPEKETGTVRRVLLLLSCLADHQGDSAQSLAARLNLPRSSVHRLLAMLRAATRTTQNRSQAPAPATAPAAQSPQRR